MLKRNKVSTTLARWGSALRQWWFVNTTPPLDPRHAFMLEAKTALPDFTLDQACHPVPGYPKDYAKQKYLELHDNLKQLQQQLDALADLHRQQTPVTTGWRKWFRRSAKPNQDTIAAYTQQLSKTEHAYHQVMVRLASYLQELWYRPHDLDWSAQQAESFMPTYALQHTVAELRQLIPFVPATDPLAEYSALLLSMKELLIKETPSSVDFSTLEQQMLAWQNRAVPVRGAADFAVYQQLAYLHYAELLEQRLARYEKIRAESGDGSRTWPEMQQVRPELCQQQQQVTQMQQAFYAQKGVTDFEELRHKIVAALIKHQDHPLVKLQVMRQRNKADSSALRDAAQLAAQGCHLGYGCVAAKLGEADTEKAFFTEAHAVIAHAAVAYGETASVHLVQSCSDKRDLQEQVKISLLVMTKEDLSALADAAGVPGEPQPIAMSATPSTAQPSAAQRLTRIFTVGKNNTPIPVVATPVLTRKRSGSMTDLADAVSKAWLTHTDPAIQQQAVQTIKQQDSELARRLQHFFWVSQANHPQAVTTVPAVQPQPVPVRKAVAASHNQTSHCTVFKPTPSCVKKVETQVFGWQTALRSNFRF